MQNKMNFSRGVYFKELIKNISTFSMNELKKKKEFIYEEIDFQIDRIYQKQKGGYWAITDGDKVFIEFMSELRLLITKCCARKLIDLSVRAQQQSEEKIKVAFFAQEVPVWTSLKSVYEAMLKDSRYIAQLIYTPFSYAHADDKTNHKLIYEQEFGLNIMNYDEYSISAESPDIVIYPKPYAAIPYQFYITEVRKVVTRCVYIPYGISTVSNKEYDRYAWGLPMHFYSWKVIADSSTAINCARRSGYCDAKNLYPCGHPRLDIWIRGKGDVKIPIEWTKKIANRKVILYNSHHSVMPGIGFGTFLNYGEKIIEHFDNQNELILIWRPHPHLKLALSELNLMNSKDFEKIFKKAKESNSIILDNTQSYIYGFIASDAMISDGSSLIKEYLFLDKPELYLKKHTSDGILDDNEFLDCLSVADRFEDIIEFLESLKKNIDEKKCIRKEIILEKFFGVHYHIGEKICNDFSHFIFEEEMNNAISHE